MPFVDRRDASRPAHARAAASDRRRACASRAKWPTRSTTRTRHGVIHRDIKPENILLQGGHALVADFGIALAVQTAGGSRMTQTGLVARHAAVHESRAGDGRARDRRAQRHLLARRRDLRDAHRRPAVRWIERAGDRRQGADRRNRRRRERVRDTGAAERRARRAHGARQTSGRSIRERRRISPRHSPIGGRRRRSVQRSTTARSVHGGNSPRSSDLLSLPFHWP